MIECITICMHWWSHNWQMSLLYFSIFICFSIAGSCCYNNYLQSLECLFFKKFVKDSTTKLSMFETVRASLAPWINFEVILIYLWIMWLVFDKRSLNTMYVLTCYLFMLIKIKKRMRWLNVCPNIVPFSLLEGIVLLSTYII